MVSFMYVLHIQILYKTFYSILCENEWNLDNKKNKYYIFLSCVHAAFDKYVYYKDYISFI